MIAETQAAPLTWRKGTVTVLLRDDSGRCDRGTITSRSGWVSGNIGLTKEPDSQWKAWILWHQPSGIVIGWFDRKRDAQGIMATLANEFGLDVLDCFASDQGRDWSDEKQSLFYRRFRELQRSFD